MELINSQINFSVRTMRNVSKTNRIRASRVRVKKLFTNAQNWKYYSDAWFELANEYSKLAAKHDIELKYEFECVPGVRDTYIYKLIMLNLKG